MVEMGKDLRYLQLRAYSQCCTELLRNPDTLQNTFEISLEYKIMFSPKQNFEAMTYLEVEGPLI